MIADSEAGGLVRVTAAGMEPPAGERLLGAGDRLPDFVLPDPSGQLRFFYQTVTGRPAVFVLFANTAVQDQWDEIKELAATSAAIRAAGADLFIVSNDGTESLEMVAKIIPDHAIWLADIKGVVNMGLRTAALFPFTGVICLILDDNQRIVAMRGFEKNQGTWALGVLRAMNKEEPRPLNQIAPVLLLPRVLDSTDCAKLLAQIPAGAPARGSAAISDKAFAEEVGRRLFRRIGPEVEKAFGIDDFALDTPTLRWDGASASATAECQRDIVDPAVEGRSFSLILDLAEDGYEGGSITFPEYGPHSYRPGSGGAIVHAGTLLRGLGPVATGRRCLLVVTLKRQATGRPGSEAQVPGRAP